MFIDGGRVNHYLIKVSYNSLMFCYFHYLCCIYLEITSLNSLTFITGVGIHSTGRKPILFPAVSKALESDGWKLEKQMSRGMIIVRGRA